VNPSFAGIPLSRIQEHGDDRFQVIAEDANVDSAREVWQRLSAP